jgi:hypothetical protein
MAEAHSQKDADDPTPLHERIGLPSGFPERIIPTVQENRITCPDHLSGQHTNPGWGKLDS